MNTQLNPSRSRRRRRRALASSSQTVPTLSYSFPLGNEDSCFTTDELFDFLQMVELTKTSGVLDMLFLDFDCKLVFELGRLRLANTDDGLSGYEVISALVTAQMENLDIRFTFCPWLPQGFLAEMDVALSAELMHRMVDYVDQAARDEFLDAA